MSLNIICTSKPVDGLLYYSYEYKSYLKEMGIDAKLIIVCYKNFRQQDYLKAVSSKYIHCEDIIFDSFDPKKDDVTLVMGRSMITLSWQNFRDYSAEQQNTLRQVFSNNVIAVYSENHPIEYPKALSFYAPKNIIDICDTEVYPNGVGEHFEKIINFNIYKPYIDNPKFKYLFTGTNDKYYASAQKVIDKFLDHGILVYSNSNYLNTNYNNIVAPIENLMGMFDTYVYVKETFDPAPRVMQECKYFGKNVIYLRDKSIVDGGSVYWLRPCKEPDIKPILNAYEKLY